MRFALGFQRTPIQAVLANSLTMEQQQVHRYYFNESRLEHQEALAAVAARSIEVHRYIKNGWPVLPLHSPSPTGGCSCAKGPTCPNPGKHPRTRNGLKDASTDIITILKWWGEWPDANVGILTGAESGLVVLDVDPRNGGNDTLAEWEEREGLLPPTLTVTTGGGGWHFYYPHPGGVVRCRKLGAGLDLKADGGYVVAPPSLHASGSPYSWGTRS